MSDGVGSSVAWIAGRIVGGRPWAVVGGIHRGRRGRNATRIGLPHSKRFRGPFKSAHLPGRARPIAGNSFCFKQAFNEEGPNSTRRFREHHSSPPPTDRSTQGSTLFAIPECWFTRVLWAASCGAHVQVHLGTSKAPHLRKCGERSARSACGEHRESRAPHLRRQP